MTIKTLDRQLPFMESRKAVNENFAALVEHLGEKAEIVVGSFVGNGGTAFVNLGFRPQALILTTEESFSSCGYLDIPDAYHRMTLFSYSDLGFYSYAVPVRGLNTSGTTYYYVALK